MRPSSQRLASLFLAVILLIAAIVVYVNLVVPEYQAINEKRGEYAAKQSALDNQRQILDKVSTLLTRYQSIGKLGEVVSLAIPSSEDVAAAFSQIHALSIDSGMTIDQFSVNSALPAKTSAKANVQILKSVATAQITLHATGSYESFKRFLESVEHNIRVMDLVSLKIQPVRSGQNVYTFAVVLNTYFQQS